MERRNRIRLSVFAYAYEFEDDPLISDGEFDRLASLIDKTKSTGNEKLDAFFAKHFEPDTGMWIRVHPELDKLKALYFMYKQNFNPRYYRIGAEVWDLQPKKKKSKKT